MPTIKRACGNRIITRALNNDGRRLLALLLPGAGDCELRDDAQQLQAGLEADPKAIIVYNRQAEAIAPVEDLGVGPSQVFVEIRQDTRGVPGLQAYRKQGRASEPLELFHE